MREVEMVEWHHLHNGHEFEQTLGDGEGQASLCAAVHAVAKSWTQLGQKSREGNGTPLQYSCLENPVDGGAW